MAGRKFNADFIIALAAMLTAVVAVIVAVVQTDIMREEAETERRHARLSVMPSIGLLYSNGRREDGVPFFELDLMNEGLGPAVVKDFAVYYKGQKLKNQRHWVMMVAGGEEQFFGLQPSANVSNSTIGDGRIVPAGEELHPVRVEHVTLANSLITALKETRFEVCACSFYGDCQRLLNMGTQPEPVATCENYQDAPVLNTIF